MLRNPNPVWIENFSYGFVRRFGPPTAGANYIMSACTQFNKLSGLFNLVPRVFTLAKDPENEVVVCSVTWPLNGSEAGGDLVLIKT